MCHLHHLHIDLQPSSSSEFAHSERSLVMHRVYNLHTHCLCLCQEYYHHPSSNQKAAPLVFCYFHICQDPDRYLRSKACKFLSGWVKICLQGQWYSWTPTHLTAWFTQGPNPDLIMDLCKVHILLRSSEIMPPNYAFIGTYWSSYYFIFATRQWEPTKMSTIIRM